MTEYYREKYEQSLLFQDMMVDAFAAQGIPLSIYSSKEFQFKKGESRQGVEIKHDTLWPTTGNVYIEVAEKSQPEMPRYTPSGILRKDNTKLYAIGNEKRVWVFAKRHLLAEWLEAKQSTRRRQTPTSIGFVIPIEQADVMAAWIIEPRQDAEETTEVA